MTRLALALPVGRWSTFATAPLANGSQQHGDRTSNSDVKGSVTSSAPQLPQGEWTHSSLPKPNGDAMAKTKQNKAGDNEVRTET
jgi:hypothetical protein